jgi:predicted amidohydrolase YtcJ
MVTGIVLMGVACLAAATVPSFAEDAADLVLRNGAFYPVSVAGRVEGSLAIREGRIVFLGPDSEVQQFLGPGTEVLELSGRAVTPGLIDAHSHLLGLGAALSQVDLVGTASYEEVVERVRAAAREVPAGDWIEGRGWDQNDWTETDFPVHGPLSRAVPDHPVWLTRIDGHAALLNEGAMRSLQLDGSVSDPSGGRFHRDGKGELTGVLIDEAMAAVRGGLPDPSPAERRRRLELAGRHCLAVGLTSVTDMGVDEAAYAAYSELRRAGELPLRAALFLDDDRVLLSRWLARGPQIDPEARLLVRGIKLYADGALGSRGAALVEPYSDDPGNMGLLRASTEEMAEVCRLALEKGFQIGIHAIGDRGALVALDAIEHCLGGPRPEVRFRIEHAQVMRLPDIHRMANLGIIASMQPTHATSDMPWAEDRVGAQRIAGAYAWRKVSDANGRLALGSDFPVESADPLLGLYAAVSRQDLDGKPAGGWYPEERLTREEALRGFTLDAAYSLFLENELGSLEVGKRADVVVFERDPMTVPVAEIPRLRVDLTLLDGEVVYHRESAK